MAKDASITFTVTYYALPRKLTKEKRRGPGPGNGGSSGGNSRDRRRWRRRLARTMGPPPPSTFAQTVAKMRDEVHALMERQLWYGDVEPQPTAPPATSRPIIEPTSTPARGHELVALLRGSAGPGMSTDEVMELTRGED